MEEGLVRVASQGQNLVLQEWYKKILAITIVVAFQRATVYKQICSRFKILWRRGDAIGENVQKVFLGRQS